MYSARTVHSKTTATRPNAHTLLSSAQLLLLACCACLVLSLLRLQVCQEGGDAGGRCGIYSAKTVHSIVAATRPDARNTCCCPPHNCRSAKKVVMLEGDATPEKQAAAAASARTSCAGGATPMSSSRRASTHGGKQQHSTALCDSRL
jgi:hypothetical protein